MDTSLQTNFHIPCSQCAQLQTGEHTHWHGKRSVTLAYQGLRMVLAKMLSGLCKLADRTWNSLSQPSGKCFKFWGITTVRKGNRKSMTTVCIHLTRAICGAILIKQVICPAITQTVHENATIQHHSQFYGGSLNTAITKEKIIGCKHNQFSLLFCPCFAIYNFDGKSSLQSNYADYLFLHGTCIVFVHFCIHKIWTVEAHSHSSFSIDASCIELHDGVVHSLPNNRVQRAPFAKARIKSGTVP